MLELKEFEKFEELQTPFWYYDLDLLRRTADEVAKYSRKYGIGVNYALKANVEPRILQIISSKGFGADCVSGNEVIYAVEHGFRPETVVFAGVGKTEVARVLSERMGMKLVRFDMSEYAEKHAVAKLIGSPAGYVGYEDGGLLTAAVRKTPNCVLLFDEIEKAHPDIFNIFLQMMDYAALTDNHGERADFRNAVIIMTSNAGAQYASRASIGFTGSVSRGDAMLTTVKKTFKPEFINRLTDIVVFHDMSRQMASLILDKKLAQLQTKLSAKNVTPHLSAEARELLLTKGFTPEYGARELDRVIGSMLKPLLMKEMLFGKLKKGGDAVVNVKDGALQLV